MNHSSSQASAACRIALLPAIIGALLASCAPGEPNAGLDPNQPSPIIQLLVSPPSATVPTDGGVTFSATALHADSSLSVPTVSWSATGGAISTSGVYTPGSVVGSYSVTASLAGTGLSQSVPVNVIAVTSPIVSLSVSPGSASLSTGGTQQFTVTATRQDGSTLVPSVSWTSTGGSITGGGRYTAGGTAGTFRVVATQQGGTLADTSIVTISAAVLQAMTLNPSDASLVTGETQQFTVTGQWSNGATTPPSVTYVATGGTISGAGLYTAGTTPGNFRVIATLQGGTLADTAAVTITAPGAGPYPHRPASFTSSSELNFSQSVPTYSDPQNSHAIVGAPGWSTTYDADGQGGSNFSRITDATAPQSPSDVWQLHWAPGTWSTSHGAGNVFYEPPSPTKLYASVRFKLDPNYAWQNTSNKFLLLSGNLIVQIQTQGRYMEAENNTNNQFMRPGLENGATMLTYVNKPISFGAWHQYEMVIDLTAGTWKQWVDGVLVLDAVGLNYPVSTFDLIDLTGHRGGGGETLTRDMYWYLDHFYVAWP